MTALDDLATTPFHDADSPQRARMLSRLADTVLSVALTAEPQGEQVELRMFPTEGGAVAIACDGEDRLAGFLGGPVDYVAMPGRVLAGVLRDDGAGLLVNPGYPSEMLLDAAMLDWLAQALSATPEEEEAKLRLIAPSAAAVDALAEALAARLADMSGLIGGAALVGVRGTGVRDSGMQDSTMQGEDAHLLLIAGAASEHQPTIAKALAEALAFLPPQPGGVDISFTDAAPPPNSLRFELTHRSQARPEKPPRPPRLR